MPSPSTGGGTSGRSVGPAPRLTYFAWDDASIGPIETITPREGEDPIEPLTPEEHVKAELGFTTASMRKDDRPTLVYFHWPHEDSKHGKLTTTICTRTMNDEESARWSKLFRCVQVDMGNTESKFAALVGAGRGPSIVAFDKDMKAVSTIAAAKIKSSTKLRKALESAFEKFPAYRKKIKAEIAEHAKWLKQARKLEKAGKEGEALELVDKIRFGNIRVHPEYDKAHAYGQKLALKVQRKHSK